MHAVFLPSGSIIVQGGRRGRRLLAAALLALVPVSLPAATCLWTGGPGYFDDPMNWDCGVDPFGPANIAIVNGAAVVGVRTSPVIFRLAVNNGAQMRVTNGTLHIQNFPNMQGYPVQEISVGGVQGAITIGEDSGLNLPCGDITLSGSAGVGGTVRMSNSVSSVIRGVGNCPDGADTRLILIDGTSIRGNGRIENVALQIQSPPMLVGGALVADDGSTLTFRPDGNVHQSTNQHLVQALGQSTLVLDGGRDPIGRPLPHTLYNQLNGIVAAYGGGTVELRSGFRITGGVLSTIGTGRLRGGGELEDVHLQGDFDVTTGETHGWANAIANNGRFTVANGYTIALLTPVVTLSGLGRVHLATNGGGDINLFSSTLRNVSNRIHGQGQIAGGILENSGVISADTNAQLLLRLGDNATWLNSGVMEATNSGSLRLAGEIMTSGHLVRNTNGLLRAFAGSTARIQIQNLHGGNVRASGVDGIVSIEGCQVRGVRFDTDQGGLTQIGGGNGPVSLADRIANYGEMEVPSLGGVNLEHTITNAGRITVRVNASVGLVTPDVTLTGGGVMLLEEFSSSIIVASPASRLINLNHTLAGRGTISANQLINRGTVAPGSSAGTLYVFQEYIQQDDGTLHLEIGGLNAGTDYDVLQVNGGVTLAGQLRVNRLNDFDPPLGTEFLVLRNLSGNPITGTFAGLAEGASLGADGKNFRIRYTGGDGNDVVLTRVAGPGYLEVPVRFGNGNVQLRGHGDPGVTFTIQATTNIVMPDWINLGPASSDVGGIYEYLDPTAPGYPVRFYRARFP